MAAYVGPDIVTEGLVLYLDAANPKSYPGSGTTWYDLSGNGNNGTLTNGLGYNTDNNGSFVFDGTNDTVDCGPVPQVGSSLTGLTVSAWVYSTSRSVRIILENGTDYTSNTFYMAQENNSYFSFLVYGASGYDLVYANYVYQLDTWYNLVGVWTPNQRIKLYTNGVLTIGATYGSASPTLINGNTNLFVGSRAGTQYPFSGKISNTKIYNRALTAEEVKQNFEATRSRYGI